MREVSRLLRALGQGTRPFFAIRGSNNHGLAPSMETAKGQEGLNRTKVSLGWEM